MGTFRMSNGERVSKAIIDRRVREAKNVKLVRQREQHGYNFCQDCHRNDCVPLDCSHDISVKECQETGRAELAWDIENITIRGRDCHNKHDKTYIGKC